MRLSERADSTFRTPSIPKRYWPVVQVRLSLQEEPRCSKRPSTYSSRGFPTQCECDQDYYITPASALHGNNSAITFQHNRTAPYTKTKCNKCGAKFSNQVYTCRREPKYSFQHHKRVQSRKVVKHDSFRFGKTDRFGQLSSQRTETRLCPSPETSTKAKNIVRRHLKTSDGKNSHI